MKKILTIIAIMAVASFANAEKYRIVEGSPGTNNIYSVSITDYSQLSSISCAVTGTGTNSYTITYTSVDEGETYTYATAVADIIGGSANDGVKTMYNTDQDTTTNHTEWLKPGDTLKLTGNDASQTAYSNVTYRVVLKVN